MTNRTAHEKPIAGIGLDYLNRFFQRQYDERRLRCLGEFDELVNYLETSLKPGDVILTVGAGNIYKVGQQLAQRLRQRDEERSAEVDVARLRAGLEEEMLFGET